MRILITGGMGFIGHTVVAQLEDMGYDDITLVDNFTTCRIQELSL
jgi:nucleoside-diphosphate-sugar epimerase